jgi:hypothetical protein
MSFRVVLIANDPDDCPAILKAWEDLGLAGVTILESTGLGHLKHTGLWDNIPLMPSIHDLFKSEEVHHRTLFSVVDDHAMVDRMLASVEQITGSLDDPHTGFMFVLPVIEVHGMGRHRKDRSLE